MPSKRRIDFLLVMAIIFLAIVVFTPRHWEPGTENWIKWASARIFRETGEFPSYSMGPLYVMYLQVFSIFQYPMSVLLEHLVTHLFAYVAIYSLLHHFMRKRYALLLTIAWIPHLATVEPGGTILGIGFTCLYFIPGRSIFRNEGYFPPALLAAALSHSVYSTFLMGHVIGTFLERHHQHPAPIPSHFRHAPRRKVIARILSVALLLLLFMIIIPSASPPQYNHILMDQTYAPVDLKSPTDAFFQNGIERYVRRTYPEAEWVYHDWYLSAPEAYNGAATIIQAFYRKPETVFRNVITNMGTGLQLPSFFLSGAFLGPISLLFFIFPLFGLLGLIQKLKEQRNYSTLISAIIGTGMALLVLALTTFNSIRYVSTLLPVWFLIIPFIPQGFNIFVGYCMQKINFPGKKDPAKDFQKIKIKIIIIGILLVIIGLLARGPALNKIISPNKEFPSYLLQQILIMDLMLVAGGITLILFVKKISVYIYEKREKIVMNRPSIILQSEKAVKRSTPYLITFSIILLLLTVQYPLGAVNQIKAIIGRDAFLSGQDPVSMVQAYPELHQYLHENTKVLANEYTWIMAFSDVELGNVYQIWSIPPFNDSSGQTQEKLKDLDVILISKTLESDRPNIGTQTYPRYIFHIKPFLEKALSEGWTEIKIDGYGSAYIKK